MMAVQMNRYKEKARKNATFEKFKLLGFDPFIYTKWDLACVECGKVVTHNTAKGTTTNLTITWSCTTQAAGDRRVRLAKTCDMRV